MDITSYNLCLKTMESALSNPLTKVISPKISDYSKMTKSKLTLEIIKSKLEENKYKSFQEWAAYVRSMFSEQIKLVGSTTPLGLSLETIFQGIKEKLADHSVDFDNVPNAEAISINRILTQLNDIIQIIPENLTDIFPLPNLDDEEMFRFENESVPKPNYNENDLTEITHDINLLSTDEDMNKLIHIVKTCEFITPQDDGSVTLNLTAMSPFTISVIKSQLRKLAQPK
ncbi:hypothetical protein TVAG_319750 [Trichomonas vaginalis G3]|uniref:Bromo domain-containing protein n=1 Tax=Trichomonas vaginalis (strain ATCC PRA-98 / G3) TaxID=412133 RepID=A2DQC3_TRIV3|nr:acetylation-dependent protein binding [Trichomonas vaginalis G3]EAY17380.1 hypothetical protein TVAG_319750 [Trichomonas vaginalis G3]KAI5491390.1 acetylation-dependent protein binding [Trichomonas vaginalis G3]|eukprot:XP_001330749.1 hypothetical protein [Trichomonas vaginalis G3]